MLSNCKKKSLNEKCQTKSESSTDDLAAGSIAIYTIRMVRLTADADQQLRSKNYPRVLKINGAKWLILHCFEFVHGNRF